MLGLVLVPGLLAAGIGMLIFIGLDSLTGFGTFALAIPGLPPFDRPTLALFGWAIVFGLVAPVLGRGIQLLAVAVRARVEPRMVLLIPRRGRRHRGAGDRLGEATGHSASNVLFSGQDDLCPLIGGAAGWSAGALLLLVLCKALACARSLPSFRGGPMLPAMFIGAAGGMAASNLPGLELVPAVAMGIGAMCTVMLTLPPTSTLLATLLLSTDGLTAMPLVIVAVVVAYVVTARLTPASAQETTQGARRSPPPPSSSQPVEGRRRPPPSPRDDHPRALGADADLLLVDRQMDGTFSGRPTTRLLPAVGARAMA